MKLYHASEESDISVFRPRIPTRKELNQNKGLVWAINEQCLPNFLTPRNCPRVTYHCNDTTTEEDKRLYLSSGTVRHVVAIENKWFKIMKETTLFLYEFEPAEFAPLDITAGYYVSEKTQVPVNKIIIHDLFEELIRRNVEVRIVDNLWDLCDQIQKTSFNWSMCRMGYAEPRRNSSAGLR